MNYSFTININLIKILKFYLLGLIPAYLIVLYFEIDRVKTYLKANHRQWKEVKNKYQLFCNSSYFQGVPMSWLLVLFFIIALIGNFNAKLTKKYFCWLRFKDIIKFRKKDDTLYFYCNNKYFGRIKNSEKLDNNKKILYRILNKELKHYDYSDETWNDIVKNLTLENFKECFEWEEIDDLKSEYEDLVFERFNRYYSKKII